MEVAKPTTLSSKQYLAQRLETLTQLKRDSGLDPYPHKYSVDLPLPKFVQEFSSLKTGEKLPEKIVRLAGRVTNKRSSGNSLIFYDLKGQDAKIQIVSNRKEYKGDFDKIHTLIHRGDIIGVEGFPGRSNTGELSIFPHTIQLLSPCLHMLPTDWHGLRDQETRYRQRYLDLIMHDETRQTFQNRTRIVKFVRNFLDERGFLEVETPCLNMIPGGASARPFVTYHNDLHMNLFMRIAPELYLKQLVIGGLERVYEIGKLFRNEGIDHKHNPEFTSCEVYGAYLDYHDLMIMTEEIVSGLVKEITGGLKLTYHHQGRDKEPIIIDFTPPFRRIDMIAGLEEATGMKFPSADQLHTDEANKFLQDLVSKYGINCSPPQTNARMLDKLTEHFIESQCVNPTFIINQPAVMSPLAKGHRDRPGLTERFELFVAHMELCNSYTELNDPVVQRERFLLQEKDRLAKDDEAQILDEDFCTALEYGLPPTGGWAIGIDRMTMFLTDNVLIKEVILFPAMKPLTEKAELNQINPIAAPSLFTEPLYLRDTYLFQETAEVLAVRSSDNTNGEKVVILNRTIYHPQGGGQPSDVGKMLLQSNEQGMTAEFDVLAVTRNKLGEIEHRGVFRNGQLNVGDKVTMIIDAEKRVFHAKLHSAGHLLDEGLRFLKMNWKAVKGYHFPDNPFVEYEGNVDGAKPETLQNSLQSALNELASSHTSVSVKQVDYDQVKEICLEDPPTFLPKDKPVRIVGVYGEKGLFCPCGGTHLKSIGELGKVTIRNIKVSGKRIKVFYSI